MAAAPAAASADLALLRLLGLKGDARRRSSSLDALSLSVEAPRHATTRWRATAGARGSARAGSSRTPGRPTSRCCSKASAPGSMSTPSRAYATFGEINTTLKQVMTAWQIRPDGTPNDHADAAYDSGVLGDLAELHTRAMPLLERLSTLSPRPATYPARGIARALRRGRRRRPQVRRPDHRGQLPHGLVRTEHRELITRASTAWMAVTEDRACGWRSGRPPANAASRRPAWLSAHASRVRLMVLDRLRRYLRHALDDDRQGRRRCVPRCPRRRSAWARSRHQRANNGLGVDSRRQVKQAVVRHVGASDD